HRLPDIFEEFYDRYPEYHKQHHIYGQQVEYESTVGDSSQCNQRSQYFERLVAECRCSDAEHTDRCILQHTLQYFECRLRNGIRNIKEQIAKPFHSSVLTVAHVGNRKTEYQSHEYDGQNIRFHQRFKNIGWDNIQQCIHKRWCFRRLDLCISKSDTPRRVEDD